MQVLRGDPTRVSSYDELFRKRRSSIVTGVGHGKLAREGHGQSSGIECMSELMQTAKKWFKQLVFRAARRFPQLASYEAWRRLAQANWQDIEHFDDEWKTRVQRMAGHIPAASRVLDLGCGKEWLKEIIGASRYIGVDYLAR